MYLRFIARDLLRREKEGEWAGDKPSALSRLDAHICHLITTIFI